MAEYWKSTPKYWCKHCSVFVRDTPLERRNHESTAKHQGAIKRSLRDLHRSADQQEREKERARREVERLNGVVSGAPGSSSSSAGQRGGGHKSGGGGGGGSGPTGANAVATGLSEAERKRQLEQLAELGVNIPTELRGSMALAGEWEVTNVRVVDESGAGTFASEGQSAGGAGVIPVGAEGRAVGVKRERERTEEEKEQEEAINGLFKRPRKWGVGSKIAKMEEDKELEELLSGGIPPPPVKKEEVKKEGDGGEEIQEEVDGAGEGEVKKEEGADADETGDVPKIPAIKNEPSEGVAGIADEVAAPAADAADAVPAVMFKKRKPKNVRQK